MSEKPKLYLLYEYKPLGLKALFAKLQALDNGYINPVFGNKCVTCLFVPKRQTCFFSREDIEWRISLRKQGVK